MQIFMSHSQKDESLQQSFDKICAREGVISKCMEFENIQFPNQWSSILEEIRKSFVVFLLLGRNVVSSEFTRNWIAFEVGIACAINNKDVWVFEQKGANLHEFPIPYLTDYMPDYSIENSEDFNYARNIVASLKRASVYPAIAVSGRTDWEIRMDWRAKKQVPSGTLKQCGACGIVFSLHRDTWGFHCPSCRRFLS